MLLLLAGCEDAGNSAGSEALAEGPAPQPGDLAGDGSPCGTPPQTDPATAGTAGNDSPVPAASPIPADVVPHDPGDAQVDTDLETASASPTEAKGSDSAKLESSATDSGEAESAPRRIDLAALYIGAAPVPQPTLSPQFATALDELRRAMRRRDILEVREHMRSAAALRISEADLQAYERMLLVHALWAQGWAHAAAAAGTLGPGDRINTWAGPALVQDSTGREIVLQIDGVPQTLSTQFGDMEVRLATALVEHRARVTGLALDAQVAAMWTFALEAGEDKDDRLAAAQEAIIEAAQRGAYVDHLIAELLIRRADKSNAE